MVFRPSAANIENRQISVRISGRNLIKRFYFTATSTQLRALGAQCSYVSISVTIYIIIRTNRHLCIHQISISRVSRRTDQPLTFHEIGRPVT